MKPAAVYYAQIWWERDFQEELDRCGDDIVRFLVEASAKVGRNYTPEDAQALINSLSIEKDISTAYAIVRSGDTIVSFNDLNVRMYYGFDGYTSIYDGEESVVDHTNSAFVAYAVTKAHLLYIERARDGLLAIMSAGIMMRAFILSDGELAEDYAAALAGSETLVAFDQVTEGWTSGGRFTSDMEASAASFIIVHAARWIATQVGAHRAAVWIAIAYRAMTMPPAPKSPEKPPEWYYISPYSRIPTSELRELIIAYRAAIEQMKTWPMTESVWASIEKMTAIVQEMERVIAYRGEHGMGRNATVEKLKRPGDGDVDVPTPGEDGSDHTPSEPSDPGGGQFPDDPDVDDDFGGGGSGDHEPGPVEPPDGPDEPAPPDDPGQGPQVPGPG
ncbi:hypothetical protein ACU8MB_16250 [Rhizobium leguminosarum]